MKKNHFITTVINYCTNDYRFIKKCATEAMKFSHEVIIPVSDHFFDGTKENRKLLDLTYEENPKCKFIEYEFTHDKSYSTYKWFDPSSFEMRHIWHSTSRYISYFFLNEKTEYVLFLDADEICEGEKFLKWLDLLEYKKYSAMRIGAYAYYKPLIRWKGFQSVSLFIDRKKLNRFLLMEVDERFATYKYTPGEKNIMILSPDGIPLIHHYSWVRTNEESLKKIKTWGHFKDKNWNKLINNNKINNEKDPFYNLSLEKSPDLFFDPLKVKANLKKTTPKKFNNVQKIFYRDILEKELKIDHNI